MKHFSWKWVSVGLAYALLMMSILGNDSPATVNGEPVPEWVSIFHGILTAGWGNFTTITVVSVLAFSAFPWARAHLPMTALSSWLCIMLTVMLVLVLSFALTFTLTFTLPPVRTHLLAPLFGTMLATMLAPVLETVLTAIVAAKMQPPH